LVLLHPGADTHLLPAPGLHEGGEGGGGGGATRLPLPWPGGHIIPWYSTPYHTIPYQPYHTNHTVQTIPYHTNHTQVDIPQEGLESFLALATDLSIKGLTEAGGANTSRQQENIEVPEVSKQNKNKQKEKQVIAKMEEENITDESEISGEVYETKFTPAVETKEELSSSVALANYETSLTKTDEFSTIEEQILVMIEKADIGWRCKMCNKVDTTKNSKFNLKRHVEGVHMEGGCHPCEQCGVTLKTRDSLKKHMARRHRNGSLAQPEM